MTITRLIESSDGLTDELYMRRAIELAKNGWGQTAPNPMVGAVVVSDNDAGITEVVGEGWHAAYGGPHAEPLALKAAGERAQGATLYVTLEPCSHYGKTPPCVEAILASGISRVVFASPDPNPQAGGGASVLEAAGVQVSRGVLEDDARELNAAFFASFRYDRPWITVKLGMTLDGAIADATGASKWITNALSRAEVQRLRAQSDAIGVGSGTYLADLPSLIPRTEPHPRVTPKRVVFDRDGKRFKLDASSPSLPDDFILLTDPNMGSALRSLKSERGINSLLIEGGSRLVGELFKGNFVDRLVIFQAPLILGRGALNAFGWNPSSGVNSAARFQVKRREQFGEDLMTVYAINKV